MRLIGNFGLNTHSGNSAKLHVKIQKRLNKDFEPNCVLVLPTAKLNISRQVYHDKHVTLKIIFGGMWLMHLQP